MKKPSIFTIGHSTRSVDDFIALLQVNGVKQIVDVRSIPKSRHNPQFNGEDLKQSLKQSGIRYKHISKLGGLRRTQRRVRSISAGAIPRSEDLPTTWDA